MTNNVITYFGGPVFDGTDLHDARAVQFHDGVFHALLPTGTAHNPGRVIDLEGDILSVGYVDLQVNGGDGVMFNDDPSVATLQRIAAAHRRLGATTILPTLITDTADKSRQAISATIEAIRAGVPGIAGLHLEGPHLSVARKGAHDAAMIRPMGASDVEMLLEARQRLPVLKMTLAPESVSLAQVATLTDAGILVSLGHTDADFETCREYIKAGARCATHLFNAMSQLGNREPGLVGAVLASGGVSAGLIADGIHVHHESMKAAWKAKTGPGQFFLVSDAMAVAGTDLTEFELEGRRITRDNGRLILADGTLAGADLDLTTALHLLHTRVGVPLVDALGAATRCPGELIGLSHGLIKGQTPLSNCIRISRDFSGAVPLSGI
ncbi:N-acetylglucosamine-6-phosphate deacetylase [Shimia sp.]|uniref:N-acetylglucosamine-6-phosphate deacetylase n=1 Tax=Shimia sp. TaxID=1954381 RepID=UPI003296DDB7